MPIITVKSEKEVKKLLAATMKCAYGDPSGSTRSQGWYWRPRPLGLQLLVTDGHLAFRLDVNCTHDLATDDGWRAPEWEALQRYTRALGQHPVCDLAGDLAGLPPCPNPKAPVEKVISLAFDSPEVRSYDELALSKGWIDFAVLTLLTPVLGMIHAHRNSDATGQLVQRTNGVTVVAPGFVGVVMGMKSL